jgi:hypothetical protein
VSAQELDLSEAPVADCAGEAPASAVPVQFLGGPYRAARDGVMQWWEREYARALSERHNGKTKQIAAEAEISLGYPSKILNR